MYICRRTDLRRSVVSSIYVGLFVREPHVYIRANTMRLYSLVELPRILIVQHILLNTTVARTTISICPTPSIPNATWRNRDSTLSSSKLNGTGGELQDRDSHETQDTFPSLRTTTLCYAELGSVMQTTHRNNRKSSIRGPILSTSVSILAQCRVDLRTMKMLRLRVDGEEPREGMWACR